MPLGDKAKAAWPLRAATRKQQAMITRRSGKAASGKLVWKKAKHSGSPDSVSVGIVLKQNNFGTMAMSLHGIFASFYREEFIEITKYKDSQAMYKIMFNNGSNVSATIRTSHSFNENQPQQKELPKRKNLVKIHENNWNDY